MKKGKYEYYNSKLFTKKAETLRDEYLSSVNKHFENKNYSHHALVLIIDDKDILIKHLFLLDGELKEFSAYDFYTLYEYATR